MSGRETSDDLNEQPTPPMAEALDDLRAAYLEAPDAAVAERHLAAILAAAAEVPAPEPPRSGPRRKVLAAVAVGAGALLLSSTGVAAARGALPEPVQDVVADFVEPIGLDLPSPRKDKAEKDKAETPGKSGEAPGQTGETPGKSGEAPGQAGETPGKSGEAPGQTGETPGKSGEAPGQTGETPGKSGEAPGQTGEAPGQSGEAPGQTGETPGKSGGNPGQGGGRKS